MADQQQNTSRQLCEGENHDETEQVHPIVENHHCLELIFMQMDIETLLSVALSNTLFQTLAVSVFKRKFGQKVVSLQCSLFCAHSWDRKKDEVIVGSKSRCWLSLLRVFGADISKLCVHYHPYQYGYAELDKSKRWSIDSMMRRIDEYINMYCADTLVSFDIQHKLKFSQNFPKPFKKIEKVRVHSTHLYDSLLDFVDWFPNLQYFEIIAECIDHRFNNVTIPQMNHLVILFDWCHVEERAVQVKNAGKLLKANPQLHTVEFHKYLICWVDLTFNDLLNMITDHRRLLKIVFGHSRNCLPCQSIGMIDVAEVNRIVSEHPELVELELDNYLEIKANDAITLVHGLKSLKKLRLNINEFEYQEFIEQLIGSDWKLDGVFSIDGQNHRSIAFHRE